MNYLNSDTASSKAYSVNSIKLIGTIIGEAAFSHEIIRTDKADNETVTFRRFTLEVQRLSGVSDFVEVIVSEKVWLGFTKNHENIHGETHEKVFVEISGRLQSRNRINPKIGENRLDLFVYANHIRCLATDTKGNGADNTAAFKHGKRENTNTISLEGFVCRKPVVRQTHSGRMIADLFIAVNYRGNSTYIPVILWSGNAMNAKSFKVGDKLRLTGRFQSREFVKAVNGVLVAQTAYEISASKVKLIEDTSLAHC